MIAFAAVLAGCGHAGGAMPKGEIGERPRIAILPPLNRTGTSVALRDFTSSVELKLAARGLEVVSGDAVEEFLERHRVRYTGGINASTARFAREDLRVDGILISSLDQYDPAVPRMAATMRLVATDDWATLLWIDSATRGGNDSPGLLGLGRVKTLPPLQRDVLSQLGDSLLAFLQGQIPPRCGADSRFRPSIAVSRLDTSRRHSVAVLPFRNFTGSRFAAEAVALEFVRQMSRSPDLFRVLEPGVVREVLLEHRLTMEQGVSFEQARLLVGSLDVDLLVAGDVFEYQDRGAGPPRLSFNAVVLDTRTREVVAASSSHHDGDEGVWFFDFRRVQSAEDLGCRMVHDIVETLRERSPSPRKAGSEPASLDDVLKQFMRAREKVASREGGTWEQSVPRGSPIEEK